ncbi:MAG: hypothetical protein ABH834_01260 [Candidatus Altiarchaeota archaeon]
MKINGFLMGLKAAILASSCCTIPLILVVAFSATGVGSITAALKIPKYKTLFMVAGSLFLLISLYLSIKRRCGGTCSIGDARRHSPLIIASIVTYAVVTATIIYLMLPFIAERLI